MNARNILAGLRLAVGTSAYATPDLAGRTFGLSVGENPQAAYLARLFGVRDIALALGALGSAPGQRRLWLQLGILCDAADVLAVALEAKKGRVGTSTAILGGATATFAVGLGVQALLAEPDVT